MSKKTPRPPSGDVIEQQVAHERQWCYARWLERLTFSQIRIAANLPADEGGLGYDLSQSAIKGLVQQARADNGDLTMSRDERLERQLVEVDNRARAARHDLEKAHALLRTEPPKLRDFDSRPEHAAAMGGYAKLIEAAGKQVESAERRLEVAMEREAKLTGLAAPTETKLDVTHRDGVMEELNAMLVRAGEKPLKVES